MALKSGSGIFIWMLNNGKTRSGIKQLTLDNADGKFLAKWFNPWDGHFSEDVNVTINNNKLSFESMTIDPARDMALWIYTNM